MIQLVAKTGFITKETWAEYFFQGGKIRWRNHQWRSLRESGHFVSYRNTRIENVYVLNRMNREVAAMIQGQAVGPPFVAQLDHDEILLRGLLRVKRSGLVADFTTEAELKLSSPGSRQFESSRQAIKYPDALLVLSDQLDATQVAVEVELTQKGRKRYVQILEAYASRRDVHQVLYVTENGFERKS